MRFSGLILTTLIFIFSLAIYGQDSETLNKEIGLSFFTLERNGETLNHRLEPKFVYGIYFNRYFSSLSWVSNIDFGKNTIDDDCPNCDDTFYGKGKMTELILSSGVRYTFLKNKSIIIKPFIETDLNYVYLRYEGDFKGGMDGNGCKVDNIYNVYGISGRTGLLFTPVQKISITFSSSYRFERGTIYYNDLEKIEGGSGTTFSAFHLRLGYLF